MYVSLSASSSNVQSPRNLPQELIDNIIDHLHSDKEALQSCVLVSRQWAASSQLHLFHDLTIRSRSLSFSSFLSFLNESSNLSGAIELYTHHLTLYSLDINQTSASIHPSISASMLHEILLRMPNLESLHLRHVSLHRENDKDTYGRKQSLGPKKSLTTLSLEDDGTSSDMMNILDILDLFSEIENLSIREIWSNSDGWNHRSIARHGGNFFLRLLYVPSRNVATVNGVVTQRIFWLPNGHSVRSLSLMREDSAESVALGDSVCLQGADLKHLEIRFSDSLMRHGKPLCSEWSNKLRFQTLSNLESISFWCTTPDDFCTGFLILPLLSTATLHNITFIFDHFAGESHSITTIEWPKFQDRLLCFSSLRTITIAFERDEIQDTIYSSWHEVIRSSWPLLHNRGLLRFETVS